MGDGELGAVKEPRSIGFYAGIGLAVQSVLAAGVVVTAQMGPAHRTAIAGGGNVSMSVARAGGSAVLTVADTGIGIPKQDQDGLFTRFFRASNAVDLAIPGSGLGLSIVGKIVANHHADLSIESAENQGTKVTVRIPLHGAGQDAGKPG